MASDETRPAVETRRLVKKYGAFTAVDHLDRNRGAAGVRSCFSGGQRQILAQSEGLGALPAALGLGNNMPALGC